MITLSLQELKKLLEEAYEAGWYGTLELKEDFVKNISNKASGMGRSCLEINPDQLTFSYVDNNTISVNVGSWDGDSGDCYHT
jgi:hypothetical protein